MSLALFALKLMLVLPIARPRRCEELGPRLDGTYVTACDGHVVRVRDGLGNERLAGRDF